MDNNERYERVKRRVSEIKEFYVHLIVYVGVIALLFVIDLFADGNPNYWWVYWPALGWGIAIVLHAARVFGSFKGGGWEERKIKEMMDKEAKQH